MAEIVATRKVMTVEYLGALYTQVPAECKYITIDEDGDVYAFVNKPEYSQNTGCWGALGEMGCFLGSCYLTQSPEDTLEEIK